MEDNKVPIYLGRVTYIVDLDYFYMQIGTAEQLDEFSVLEEGISGYSVSASSIKSVSDLEDNQIVLVDGGDTYKCWKRGQVTRIDSDSNTADVFYIDYGETENISEKRIYADISDDVLSFPSQALRCCLAGIRPIAKKWTTRAAKVFQKETEKKTFNTVILATENGIFKVALYSQDDKQRCLSNILVDEELGFPVDEEVTELFEDVQDFFASKISQNTEENYEEYNQWGMGTEDQYTEGQYDQPMQNDLYSQDQDLNENEGTPYYEKQQEFVPIATNTEEFSPYSSMKENKSFSSPLSSNRNSDVASPLGTLLQKISQRGDKSLPSSSNSSPSTSMMVNIAAAMELSKNNSATNYTKPDPISPQVIPQFDLDCLHQTEIASTDSLMEKVHKEAREAYKIEQARVKKETKEQAKLAVLAGYGGLEDDSSSPQSSPEKPKDCWSTSSSSYTAGKEDWDKELSESSDIALKDIKPPSAETRESAHGRELVKILHQIFADSDKEPVEEIRVRLLSLFQTDAYRGLNQEELTDVLNTILNRAVRYYGVMHDVLLEILEILSGIQLFNNCLYEATKRIQDMYIKIQYKGKPFHIQCSKVIGHLFNMSFHWKHCEPLREYVASILEKWIMFNKQGKQIGLDTLQDLYLECFETLWEISGDALLDTVQNVKSRLLRECRDKILNAQVSHNIREKALHIYLILNKKRGIMSVREEGVQACVSVAEVACQTDDKVGDPVVETLFNVPVKHQKVSTSRLPFYPPKSSQFYKPRSRSSTPTSDKSEDSWPCLPASKESIKPLSKKDSPVMNRKHSGSERQSTPKSSSGDNLSSAIHLLPPASFGDSSVVDDGLSSPESSVYYSMNENSNNCSLLGIKDTSLNDRSKSLKDMKDKNALDSKQRDKRDVSPLSLLIQKDATSDFNQTNETKSSNKTDTPKTSQVKAEQVSHEKNQVTDWWKAGEEAEPNNNQSEVKDNWYDTDSSENLSVKSETVPAKSLDDVANILLTNSSSSQSKTTQPEDISSRMKQDEQVQHKQPSTISYASAVNPSAQNKDCLDKNNYSNMENLKPKTNTDWDYGFDQESNTDDNIDDFEDDDDEDWESYTESTDENSSKAVEPVKAEKTTSNPPKSKTTIIREYVPEKPKPNWKPGARKCTVCGDTSHLIYECPNKHKKGFFY